jgi:hypothetical protein
MIQQIDGISSMATVQRWSVFRDQVISRFPARDLH